MAFDIKDLFKLSQVPPGKKIDLRKDYDPGFTAPGWSKSGHGTFESLKLGISSLPGMDRKGLSVL